MAFKRSRVRFPSAPPPFALEFSRASGGKPFSLATICRDGTRFQSEGCPPKPPPSPRLRRIFPEVLTKGNWRRGTIMKYVYLLQSLAVSTQRYVGVTSNLKERLQAHNAGASSHTSKYRPWKVVTYLGFQSDRRAAEFERYLKTGSGQAFANKRLW